VQADYEFTTDWFSRFQGVWQQVLAHCTPSVMLEIGSWEGRASTFLIEACGAQRPVELHCVDTWAGGVEHTDTDMAEVERRFDANVALACDRSVNEARVLKHKSRSAPALARLISEGRCGGFDLIYVDGSHQAPDVLTDAVLAFQLLRVGGVMVFDDYLWALEPEGQQDAYNMPKPAIDAFVNIFQRKLSVIGAPLYQLYVEKRGE
jgi:predicted O-methyltransferase YrrM